MRYPRFACPACGQLVASLYACAIYVSALDARGRRHQYAYLRRHTDTTGQRCPADTTGPLATVVASRGRGRGRREKGRYPEKFSPRGPPL